MISRRTSGASRQSLNSYTIPQRKTRNKFNKTHPCNSRKRFQCRRAQKATKKAFKFWICKLLTWKNKMICIMRKYWNGNSSWRRWARNIKDFWHIKMSQQLLFRSSIGHQKQCKRIKIGRFVITTFTSPGTIYMCLLWIGFQAMKECLAVIWIFICVIFHFV